MMRYRGVPAVYRVDDAYSALTNRKLRRLGLGTGKIVQLTYILDLSNMTVSENAPKLVGRIAGEAPL